MPASQRRLPTGRRTATITMVDSGTSRSRSVGLTISLSFSEQGSRPRGVAPRLAYPNMLAHRALRAGRRGGRLPGDSRARLATRDLLALETRFALLKGPVALTSSRSDARVGRALHWTGRCQSPHSTRSLELFATRRTSEVRAAACPALPRQRFRDHRRPYAHAVRPMVCAASSTPAVGCSYRAAAGGGWLPDRCRQPRMSDHASKEAGDPPTGGAFGAVNPPSRRARMLADLRGPTPRATNRTSQLETGTPQINAMAIRRPPVACLRNGGTHAVSSRGYEPGIDPSGSSVPNRRIPAPSFCSNAPPNPLRRDTGVTQSILSVRLSPSKDEGAGRVPSR